MTTIGGSGSSLGIQRQLINAGNELNQANERIASGRRINSAADDAAGLAIATEQQSQIRGFETARRNASDAISLTQVADGALGGLNEATERIRELSLQAANGTLSDRDRGAIQAEVAQLQEEIQRQVDTTSFNGRNLLDGNFSADFQVGADAGETVAAPEVDFQSELDALLNVDVSTQAGASAALDVADGFRESVNETRSEFGALENRLQSTIDSLDNNRVNTEASRSRIEDADFAAELSRRSAADVREQVGIALQAQANADRGSSLRLLTG